MQQKSITYCTTFSGCPNDSCTNAWQEASLLFTALAVVEMEEANPRRRLRIILCPAVQ